ncbi:MAG TPA: hypothetical protein VEZ40_07190, partial [Pyrinomonadaceae bacterium]|nr:hypothetical protein [Pyrinomonadaceae bacterium]
MTNLQSDKSSHTDKLLPARKFLLVFALVACCAPGLFAQEAAATAAAATNAALGGRVTDALGAG